MPVLGLRPFTNVPGISSLAATLWVLTQLCVWVGSQGVIRERPAEIIRPKQIKIWPCEGRALLQPGMQGKNGPCPTATQLSLIHSAGRRWSSAGWSHQESGRWGLSISSEEKVLVRIWRQLGDGPQPKVTQLSHWYPLSLPKALHSGQGSWLLSRA